MTPPKRLEHILDDYGSCWCEPNIEYDTETGEISLIVHKDTSDEGLN